MSSDVADETGQSQFIDPDVPKRQRLNQRIRNMLIGVFLLDAGVLFVTSVLAWEWQRSVDKYWAEPPYPFHWAPLLGPGLIAIWLLMLVLFGAYRTRNYGAGFEEFRAITIASAVTFGIACMGGFLSYNQPTRGYPIIFLALGAPLLLLVRYIDRQTLHSARREGRLSIRMIAVGSPTAIAEIVEVLARAPWMGYRLVGMCVPGGQDTSHIGVPVFGDIEDVRRVAIDTGADGVIVAGGSYSSGADLRRLGWELQGLDLDMLVVPALTDIAGPRVHMRHVAGLPFVQVEEPQSDRAGGWMKRIFDLTAATAVVTFLSPLLFVTGLIIWLQDRGPIFYRQTRVGINGEEFQMVKFRSMIVNADALKADLAEHNESDEVLFKMANDPRITRFGRFIRKYSIDELPQLVNVFRGEMSLVGPRPRLPAEVELFEKDTHRRMLVRPGMTGLWQVSGRSDLTWAESVRLDLYYVDNWSMVIDLVIILRTVKAVIVSHGAY
ncbi:sugar transferase [Nocardioides marmorisolisilvae]|uniref:Sugar transferase n=1 Tax=Nocardioides marmorisolisilvae TaxID=1542737 RepID=A0A3N0DPA7_9ACTN|nr:sugar transferase [Nocardioides marmorisolisilvae]RNL77478.1 sugar transferase [Nocardioides marmorisolisilvae]